MNCARCGKRIYQPYQGPMWIDAAGADTCSGGGQHEPDDGKAGE